MTPPDDEGSARREFPVLLNPSCLKMFSSQDRTRGSHQSQAQHEMANRDIADPTGNEGASGGGRTVVSPKQQESNSSKGGARSRWHSTKTDLSAYRPSPKSTQGSYRAGASGADLSKYQPSDSTGPTRAARPHPSQPSFEQGRNKSNTGSGKVGKVAHSSSSYVGRSGGTSGHEVSNDKRAPKATSTGATSKQAEKKGQAKNAGPKNSDSSDGPSVGPHQQRWKHPGVQGEGSRTKMSQTKEVNSRGVRSDGGNEGIPSQQEQSQQYQPRNQLPQQPQSQPQLQQYQPQYTPQQQQQTPGTSQHVQSISGSAGNSGFAPYQQTYSQQSGAAPVSAAVPDVTAAPTSYGATGMQGANKTSTRPETAPQPISGYYGGNDTASSTAASGSAAPATSTISVAGSTVNRQWLTHGQAQAPLTTSVQQVAQPAYTAVSPYQQHATYSATPAQQGSTQYGAASTATAPPNQGVAQVATTPATGLSLVQNSSGTGVQNYSLVNMQSATVSYQQQAQSNVQVCGKRGRRASVTV